MYILVLSAFHDESVREEKYDLIKWLRMFKCHGVDTSAEYCDKEMTQWDCMGEGRCERGPSERRGRGVGSELKPLMCLLPFCASGSIEGLFLGIS